LREAGDAAEFRGTARRIDDGLPAPTGHGGSGQGEICECRRHSAAGINLVRDSRHRSGFSRERRQIETKSVARNDARIGRHGLALRQHEDIARHDLARTDHLHGTIAPHRNLPGQQRLQCFGCPLYFVLLPVAEQAVDDDDRQDRPSQLRHPGQERQQRARPQEQRKQVNEVCPELDVPNPPNGRGECVWTIPAQAVGGFRIGQAAAVRPETLQSSID
jgi:hypothetical protein